VKHATARWFGLIALGIVACSNHSPTPPAGSGGASGGMGSSGTGAGGMAASGAGGAPLACEHPMPGVAPLRLLTHVQYDNSVADLLGDTTRPSSSFPAENEVGGYRNNVAANKANPRLVESFQTASESLAATAVATQLATLAPCAEGADLATCGRSFIASFGTKAFRRPLTSAEAGIFAALFDASVGQGYAKAVELTLRALLQSPQFLYRVDALRAPTEESGAIALGPYELGARLAFFLTNSTPDDVLLTAAANNQLATEGELEAQARRLLETARAREMARDFVGQWLGLQRLDGAARQTASLPYAPTELVPDWKVSLSAFFDDAMWNDGTLAALLTSPKLFLTEKLATVYGAPVPSDPTVAVSVPAERSGLLTQPAIMALLAHADQSAPVLRGVFVREKLLCLEVEPPPPDVVAVAPMVDETATTRERFAQHTAQPSCRGCHALLDGIGFGFERYDQLGRYRETENSLPVDDSGEVVESLEPTLDGVFHGAIELSQRLAQNARVRDCVATQWYRYAMGRVEDETDACSLTQAKARFASGNGAFRELLIGIVLSDAFRYRPALETP
jgi:hypothetical protein